MKRRIVGNYKAVVLGAILVLLLAIITGCSQSFSSNGQRIYFNSNSASGDSIYYSGGPGTMMQGRLACVNCHGPQGRGGTINMMMQRFDAPNITWTELTAENFTEQTVKRAITQGLDESGEALNYVMPRWQISDSDLNDLVDFLKTLK